MQAPKWQASAINQIKLRPSMDSVLIGLIAVLVLLVFRIEFHYSLAILLVETVVFLLIPIGIFAWHLGRSNSRTDTAPSLQEATVLQAGCLLFALLPVIAQSISRSFLFGESNEVVMLLVAQNAAWYLTLFSYRKSFGQVAFVLFNSLVMFVCFRSDHRSVHILSLVFFTTSLWWLMGAYWNRVKVKAIDAESTTLPIRISFLTLSIVLLFLVGTIAWFNKSSATTLSIAGFMPTSGGNQWTSAYSRSGLGDGDMLAAGEDATTTGAVDSDQFIEDDKPSIYDMMSEKYEAPAKPITRRNRAIALEELSKHIHNAKQSEQAGRTFRTVRKAKRPEQRRSMEDRITDALFFVEGSVPARFAVTTYNQFDGWDWSNKELDWKINKRPSIKIEQFLDKSWYVIQNPDRYYLNNHRWHKVKMMRLETKALPSPSFLKSWHIYRIADASLFDWGDEGLVEIGGEFIAPHTVIDMVSKVPNYFEIRNADNLSSLDSSTPVWDWIDQTFGLATTLNAKASRDSSRKGMDQTPFTEVPENETKRYLAELSVRWTEDVPVGWQQVETIVDNVRQNYTVDSMNVAPEDCEDSVGYFLESGSGPTYLFATAAAQILRAAGYETRLASGFIVRDEDYVSASRQSVVSGENVHVWPEVCLDGWHWIPVEPTPGYPQPFGTQSIWQTLQSAAANFIAMVRRYPLSSLAIVLLGLAVIRYRGELLSSASYLFWTISGKILPNKKLKLTRQLIDVRCWAAGCPRPAFVSAASWFRRVDNNLNADFFRFWNMKNYSNHPMPSIHQKEIHQACYQLVRDLSYRKIKGFSLQQKNRNASAVREPNENCEHESPVNNG